MIPQAGLGVEVFGTSQSFVRDREEEIQRVFGTGPLPENRALGLAFGPVVGAELPLPRHTFLLGQVKAGGRVLNVSDALTVRPDVQGSLAFGLKF